MDSSLHPTGIRIPQAQLESSFFRANYDRVPDAMWHFRLVLPTDASLAPQEQEIPQPDTLTSLALFQREEPACDLEIYGMALTNEIDPAEWLEFWVLQQNMKVVSRRIVPTQGGATGDMIVKWDLDGQEFMGRIVAMKFGHRLMLAWCRCRDRDYPEQADAIFVSLATIDMVDGSPGLLAEPVNTVNHQMPRPWKVVMPQSWQIEPDLVTTDLVSLRAQQGEPITPEQYPAPRFALAVAQRRVATAEQAFALAIESLNYNKLELGAPMSTESQPSPAFEKVWDYVTPVKANGFPYEIRCRVQNTGELWMSAAAISPSRELLPLAWMQGKRLLDIAAISFELVDQPADVDAQVNP